MADYLTCEECGVADADVKPAESPGDPQEHWCYKDCIAALRAKLEQAEAAYQELNVRLAGVEAERDAARTGLANTQARVRELEQENRELAHAAAAEGQALREFREQRDRLQRVVDGMREWLNEDRQNSDVSVEPQLRAIWKLDALLREGK